VNPQTMTLLAAADPSSLSLAFFGAAIGCGLIIIGAAVGIGFLGAKALEATARQPEAGGRLFTTMIVAAALLEGVTFFALLICFLMIFWLR